MVGQRIEFIVYTYGNVEGHIYVQSDRGDTRRRENSSFSARGTSSCISSSLSESTPIPGGDDAGGDDAGRGISAEGVGGSGAREGAGTLLYVRLCASKLESGGSPDPFRIGSIGGAA